MLRKFTFLLLGAIFFAVSAFAQTPLPDIRRQLLIPGDSVSIELSLLKGDKLHWSLLLEPGQMDDGETRVSIHSNLDGEIWSKVYASEKQDLQEDLKIEKEALYRINVKKSGNLSRPIVLAAWPQYGKSGRTPFPVQSIEKDAVTMTAGDRFSVDYEFAMPDTTSFATILDLELPSDLVRFWAMTPAGDSIPGNVTVKRWLGEAGTISFRDKAKRGGSFTLRLECDVPEGGEIIFNRAPGRTPPSWLPKEARVSQQIEHSPWLCIPVPPFSAWRSTEMGKEVLPPKAKYAAQGLRVSGVDSATVAALTKVYEQRDSLYLWRRHRLATITDYDSTFLELTHAFDPPKLHVTLSTPLSGEAEAKAATKAVSWYVESATGKDVEGTLYAWQYDEAVLSYPQAPTDHFWSREILPLSKSLRTFSPTGRDYPNTISLPPAATLRPVEGLYNSRVVRDDSRRNLGLYFFNPSQETVYLAYRVALPIERTAISSFKKWPKAARWAIGIALVSALLGGFAIWELRQRDKRRRKQAEEYASELENARQVQQKLLPKGPMEVRGMQVLGLHQSMQSVGGDYYDFFPLEDGRVLICVADVAGHGLPAALLMSNLQATLHAIANQRRPINEMVALLNNEMVRRTSPDRFVTLMLAEISSDRSMLTVCNAGHNPGYLVRKHGAIVELDAGGIMLGVMEMFPFIHMEYSLEPGDLLAFYTDGIPEAEIGFEDMFGYDRLQYFLSEHRDRPLPDIAQALFTRVTQDNTALGDDMAVVLVRIPLGGSGKSEAAEKNKAKA
ncbi:MAG: serine/threonine-protein phosphatase [Calditrichaeota bacterium]|nr:serine/threonine-protein phosphatase [Calditrichota bacterium]MCB9369447.1 serine/threonine-protein phosphatase [Calditrichota bacterium]